MKIDLKIERSVPVVKTPRTQQLLGLFDVPPVKQSTQNWHHQFTLPDEWNVGVIVGPSGAGKTTLAREAFGGQLVSGWDWPAEKSIVDGFPATMGIKDITGLLSSVGFSSPPSWLRPFAVLSNGEQFRVTIARTLAEMPELAVCDEFTSVVDRTVAQIGSAAIAKAVRRRGQKFVAVTCHYDVVDWLEPDWVYQPHTGEYRENIRADGSRGSLWRRPPIELEIVRVHRKAWELFSRFHYLNTDLHRASRCFLAMVNGQPAAFTAVMSFPHATRPGMREHRTVALPDYQGVGIGNVMSEYVASLFPGRPYRSCTSHPSMIRHRAKSPLWKMTRKPSMISVTSGRSISNAKQMVDDARRGVRRETSVSRLTATFEYVGPSRPADAAGFGLPVKTTAQAGVRRAAARVGQAPRKSSDSPAPAPA